MEDRIILESTEIEVICPRFVNLEHGWLGQVIVRTAFLKAVGGFMHAQPIFFMG